MAPPSTPDKFPSLYVLNYSLEPDMSSPNHRDHFDRMARIHVGKDSKQKSFEIHKGILCFYAGYFQRALNGSFVEAKKGEVTLATESPHTFDMFQYWLYTRRFLPDTGGQDTRQVHWTDLWVFGDAHEVPLLQNAVANQLVKRFADTWKFPTQYVGVVYAHTTANSKLRRLVIDLIGKTSSAESHLQPKHYNLYPQEALIDLLGITWRRERVRMTREDVRSMNVCDYHVHEDGVTCTAAVVVP
ncbi:hypothetical protein LTR08_006599 [Meristemomyces frigidus]|nr:hypothetical protein LTR08_006599 [Meristemomyces frigidus]